MNLDLSDSDFWHLTLAQFNELSKRYHEKEEWLDYRAALAPWMLAEINRDRKKRTKAFEPQDFMPKKAKTKQMSDEDMRIHLGVINKVLGGEEK